MTVQAMPWAIQGQSHDAAVARNMIAAIYGVPVAAVSAASQLMTAGGGHGVVRSSDLAVTQNGTPNMSVNVAAGRAIIRSGNASSIEAACWSFMNDATVNVVISAADATNPRRDLVVAQVRDSNYSEAASDARITVVTGTPAASPSDPALTTYPNCVVLARVAVAAGATTITNANITDLRTHAAPSGGIRRATSTVRPSGAGVQAGDYIDEAGDTGNLLRYYGATNGWLRPWNLPWGQLSLLDHQTSTSALAAGISTSETTTNLVSTAVQTFANRRYRVTFQAEFRGLQGLTSYGTVRVRRGSGTSGTVVYGPTGISDRAGTSSRDIVTVVVVDAPGAQASQQWTLTFATDAGLVDVYAPALVLVEDIGSTGNAPTA